jgi:hypothetical protein
MNTHDVRLAKAMMLLLVTFFTGSNLLAHDHGHMLYMPVLQATRAADLGLALSNPTLSPATVTLMARGLDGQGIFGDGITNPVTLTIPASGQRALQPAEIFGARISGKTGWLELESSTPAVKGFFVLFDADINYIDGAELVSGPAARLIFPKVSVTRDSTTNITLINTASAGVKSVVTAYDNNGNATASHVFAAGPFSGFSGPITSLVHLDTGFEGYAVVETVATPFSAALESLVGFETYRNRSDIALLLGLPESATLRTGFLPHLASQGGYQTKLGLVNYSNQTLAVKITADGLTADGKSRIPGSVTIDRILPANGRLEERADHMFTLTGDALIAGSIRFEVQGNAPGLLGYLDLGTMDGILLSALPAQGSAFSDLYFSHVAEGSGFYTGLAFLNPNTQASSVTVDVFNREGHRVDSGELVLAPGERRSQILSELLPSAANQLGGFVHVTASRPIFANQLFGSRTNPTFLANVSAHGVRVDTAKPAIHSISPASVAFGTASVEIRISGTGFQANSSATYDGAAVRAVFVDSTLLLVSISSSQLNPAVHSILVSNQTPGGGISNRVEFTVGFPLPVLSTLSPSSIGKGSQAEVTIRGSGFTSSSIVFLDGTPGVATFLDPTSMKVVIVGSETGTRSIVVRNPAPAGGMSNPLPFSITAPASPPPPPPPAPAPAPAPAAPPSVPPVLSVTPSTVAVQVLSSTAVGAYDVTIAFDKNVVNCSPDNVTGGNGAGFNGRPITVNCQNAEGTLRLNHFQSGNSPAASFTVANVVFIPVGAGTSDLTLTINALTDTSGLANIPTPPARLTLSSSRVSVTGR